MRKNDCLEKDGRHFFWGNCFNFEISWDALAKFEYLVHCILDQLSCDYHRGPTLPVCPSALTAGN